MNNYDSGDDQTNKTVKKFVKSVEDGPGAIGDTVVNGLKTMGETADKASKAPGKFRKAVAKKFGL